MPHSRAAAEAEAEPAAKREPKPAPKSHAPTCGAAVDHVMIALLALFREPLSPEERKALESMRDVLQSMRADGLQERRRTLWTEAQRQCVVDGRASIGRSVAFSGALYP
jgi:hypothetical protein